MPQTKGYLAHVVFVVGFLVAWPLWREFHEPGQPIWNVFLGAFLIALIMAAFLGVRSLQKNRTQVGEARFTSARASDDSEG